MECYKLYIFKQNASLNCYLVISIKAQFNHSIFILVNHDTQIHTQFNKRQQISHKNVFAAQFFRNPKQKEQILQQKRHENDFLVPPYTKRSVKIENRKRSFTYFLPRPIINLTTKAFILEVIRNMAGAKMTFCTRSSLVKRISCTMLRKRIHSLNNLNKTPWIVHIVLCDFLSSNARKARLQIFIVE
ncbi:Hypothetical_protein [Hexamita inflata]|uniref:Hypothetical_protein n=1 Tax=Hexamita inflata TaxID=28002 RepID=A0AA86URG3_9EUKA|nr:Hypothetical protein HINF_LOCUS52844 [Hexamita inflata]